MARGLYSYPLQCCQLCQYCLFLPVSVVFFQKMPPRKRPATQATAPAAIPSVRPNKRARRPRLGPEEVPTIHERITPEEANVIASHPSSSSPGTVSVDVDAITATISAVITQAVKTASSSRLRSWLRCSTTTPQRH